MVKTRTLHATATCETVTCNGRVVEAVETQVTLPADLVVGEVRVAPGDAVEKGDILFTVDAATTLKAMANTDGAAAVQAALGGTVSETVAAPCSGVISAVMVTEGALLEKDTVAVSIADDSPVCIRLSVPERHIRSIAVGQQVSVSGVGFQKAAYRGQVTDIASTAKQTVNGAATETVVEAMVSLDAGEADDSLRVGLNAKGAVTVATYATGFLLPYAAVEQDEDNNEYVYILRDNIAEKRTFTALAELNTGYLVTDGFAEGEVLILTPERVSGKNTRLLAEEE